MPRMDPARGVSMDAAREVEFGLRRNSFLQTYFRILIFLYKTPDQPPLAAIILYHLYTHTHGLLSRTRCGGLNMFISLNPYMI